MAVDVILFSSLEIQLTFGHRLQIDNNDKRVTQKYWYKHTPENTSTILVKSRHKPLGQYRFGRENVFCLATKTVI